MTEKHYAGDWAKAKSRDLVKDRIERTLLTFRKPEDLSVLCFPGIDGAEVIQVYDTLGIPRENITGLERDPRIAEQIETNCPGIQVINQGLDDYVAELRMFPFDVVSLDYIGGVNEKQLETTSKLVNGMQKDHAIFHIANLIRRDPKAFDLYARVELRNSFENGEGNELERVINTMTEVNEEGFKKKHSANLKKNNHANLVLTPLCIYSGKESEVLKWVMGDEYGTFIEEFQKVVDIHAGGERILTVDPRKPVESVSEFPYFEILLHQSMKNFFDEKIGSFGISTEGETPEILMEIINSGFYNSKRFLLKNAEPYSYVSESGSPMVGVVAFGSYPRVLAGHRREVLRHFGFPNKFEIKEKNKLNSAYRKLAKAHNKFTNCEPIGVFDREPIFLGSSAKPILTKGRAIEELRNGSTIEEIRENFRGPKCKSLPAFKAHLTMGTYDPKEPALENIVDSDIETITKEEAIDMLREGIPSKEINEAYPTSFTSGQLSAFKAHLTMGSYPEEELVVK